MTRLWARVEGVMGDKYCIENDFAAQEELSEIERANIDSKWKERTEINALILRAEKAEAKLATKLATWQADMNDVLRQRDDLQACVVRLKDALETIANGYIRRPICPHMGGTIECGNHLMNRAMMMGLASSTLRGEE